MTSTATIDVASFVTNHVCCACGHEMAKHGKNGPQVLSLAFPELNPSAWRVGLIPLNCGECPERPSGVGTCLINVEQLDAPATLKSRSAYA